MTEPQKKVNPLAALQLRGRLERERRLSVAEASAQKALSGARRALGKLARRCAALEEARALLSEAQAATSRVTDAGERAKLETRLGGIKQALQESEDVCHSIRRTT